MKSHKEIVLQYKTKKMKDGLFYNVMFVLILSIPKINK